MSQSKNQWDQNIPSEQKMICNFKTMLDGAGKSVHEISPNADNSIVLMCFFNFLKVF